MISSTRCRKNQRNMQKKEVFHAGKM